MTASDKSLAGASQPNRHRSRRDRALAWRMDGDLQRAAWPAQRTVAADVGVSERTVRYAVARLVAADVLHVIGSRARRQPDGTYTRPTNRYLIRWKKLAKLARDLVLGRLTRWKKPRSHLEATGCLRNPPTGGGGNPAGPGAPTAGGSGPPPTPPAMAPPLPLDLEGPGSPPRSGPADAAMVQARDQLRRLGQRRGSR